MRARRRSRPIGKVRMAARVSQSQFSSPVRSDGRVSAAQPPTPDLRATSDRVLMLLDGQTRACGELHTQTAAILERLHADDVEALPALLAARQPTIAAMEARNRDFVALCQSWAGFLAVLSEEQRAMAKAAAGRFNSALAGVREADEALAAWLADYGERLSRDLAAVGTGRQTQRAYARLSTAVTSIGEARYMDRQG